MKPDSSILVYSSFRIDEAVGNVALPSSEKGVPQGTLALTDGISAPLDDDLALLALDDGEFTLAVSFRHNEDVYTGRLILDEGLTPIAAVVEDEEDDTSMVFLWEEAVNFANVEIAPELGVYNAATDELVRQPGRYRPISQATVVVANLSGVENLKIAASVRDTADQITIEYLDLP